jgi:hypothetical protein
LQMTWQKGELTWSFQRWDPGLRPAAASAWRSFCHAWSGRRGECIHTAGRRPARRRSCSKYCEKKKIISREWDSAYSKLPCSRSAMGASGLTITLQAPGTSTSRIALRLSLRVIDREPRVATSLWLLAGLVSGSAFEVDAPYSGYAVLRRREDCLECLV